MGEQRGKRKLQGGHRKQENCCSPWGRTLWDWWLRHRSLDPAQAGQEQLEDSYDWPRPGVHGAGRSNPDAMPAAGHGPRLDRWGLSSPKRVCHGWPSTHFHPSGIIGRPRVDCPACFSTAGEEAPLHMIMTTRG